MIKKNVKKQKTDDTYTGPRCILITGAAGYVGAMLCDQFSQCPGLKEIIAIDKEPMPELLAGNKKITWVTAELSADDWQSEVAKKMPEVVIHCAWQIRELFEQKDLQRKLNIEASKEVFDFVFGAPSVKKLIHFSTISVYGAAENNTKERLFIEGDMHREGEYLYGVEKKEVEAILAEKYANSDRSKKVFVLRPGTIMGPRCKYMMKKEGLLYYLENKAPFIPIATEDWGRQYLHEDDLTDIVAMLTFNNVPGRYESFNLAPADLLLAKDFGEAFKKGTFYVPPVLVQIAFFFAWHLSQGKISTGAGIWKYLCYPIFVDGSKVVKYLKYQYQYSSKEALAAQAGRYDYVIPKKEN